ncbi:MAG: L-threonylcarbamoyladenylate synthase [bacterium]
MSLILSVDPANPPDDALAKAADTLRAGGILAYPTETLYGLGVDPFRADALEKLFRLKARPEGLAVSALVRDEAMMRQVVLEVPALASRLVEAFLPGPLTLVLLARPELPERLTAGTGRVGVRISSHPLVARLFSVHTHPFTTTSANPSGMPGARSGAEVAAYFPHGLDCLLDAGPVPGGTGSTVVDVTGAAARILRQGALSREDLARVVPVQEAP